MDLGLFLEGRQVAVQLEPPPAAPSQGDATLAGSTNVATAAAAAAAASAAAAKAFAEGRTRQRVLQSFGWAVATVSELEWAAAMDDDHTKVHLVLGAVKMALGKTEDGEGGHQHHSGCGCH